MITPEEKAQIQAISNLENPTKADVIWLREIIDRLSRTRPTEWEFPKFVALIAPVNLVTLGLKFDGLVHAEQPYSFKPGTDIAAYRLSVFERRIDCKVSEAMLCIRPYIRMHGPVDDGEGWTPQALKQLRQLTEHTSIRMEIDGAPVIDDEPAEAYLVGVDGYGLRRKPSNIRVIPGDLLRFGRFDADAKVIPEDYGVFLPNNSRVTISLKNLRPPTNQLVNMSTGLVMARYTSQGVGHPHHNPMTVTAGTGAQI